MVEVIWLVPAFPLAGFLLLLLFGRRLGEPFAGVLAATMVLASFVVSVGAYADLLSMDAEERAHVETLYSWIAVGGLHIDLAFLADPLSIVETSAPGIVPQLGNAGQLPAARFEKCSPSFVFTSAGRLGRLIGHRR